MPKYPYMRLIALLFFSLSMTIAQAAPRYFSRITDTGTCYFFTPKSIQAAKGIKSFNYDMTYVVPGDSVVINFTIIGKAAERPSQLTLTGGNGSSIKCNNFSTLFVDIDGKNFEVRVTSRFHVTDVRAIFQGPQPLSFNFTQGTSSFSCGYTNSQWQKDRNEINRIFQLIDITQQ